MFLWYKSKEDKRNQRREEVRDASFIKAINATTVAVTKGMDLVGQRVEVVDHKVDKIHEDSRESREIIKSMYNHSKQMADELGRRKIKVSVSN